MNVNLINSILPIFPELVVLLSSLVILMTGVLANDKQANKYFHLIAFFIVVMIFSQTGLLYNTDIKVKIFSDMFIVDAFSQSIKTLLVVATFLVLIISYSWFIREDNTKFEFSVLILFSLLGMMLMVSANNLMALYISLELASLPLYLLASFERDSLRSTESGVKYFVLGAIASGIMLFGSSLLYGFTGSLSFSVFANLHSLSSGALLGLVLVITGFCFKISAAPFHNWTPDVYQGAPTPVTAYFSVVPKIAAMAILVRFLIQAFGGLIHDWQQIILFVSALSMIVGALGGLTQTNIKRLLAYSSIGHVGYALMGLASGTLIGVSGIIVYFTLYIAMSIGAFACILYMQREGEYVEEISDLSGIAKTKPGIAFALALFMFSMAGIPPLAGFFGKMYVFLAAMESGLSTLAVIGVLSSVVACFYYLKIVKVMYFDDIIEPLDDVESNTLGVTIVLCAVFTLLFFIMPTPLVSYANLAAGALFK